jgi:hypothetical protein
MDDMLKIVSLLKDSYPWLSSYQRKTVAACVVSVTRAAQRAGVESSEVARMFKEALAGVKDF